MTYAGPPLRIGFPVIDCGPYCLEASGPAIILQAELIPEATIQRDSVPHLKVTGQLQSGAKVVFTVPLSVYRAAFESPVLFTSDFRHAIGAAPMGILFDKNGRPLARRAV